MALLNGRLFAGAIFAGALFASEAVETLEGGTLLLALHGTGGASDIVEVTAVQPPQNGGIGGWGRSYTKTYAVNGEKRQDEQTRIAQIQADDEIILAVIINAVTKGLI